ncbi:interferon-induced 35 kDa protein isoform X1 [Myripristis murdjan]|uniref:interferon-induced 35 kDa protein isoform X1 n=1 Tax=Myripristis murdjan TaxID=586833 RepID=UPI001176189A|nr:interferon-induced 35 kDa protein isoform X1 [Myripristis murdjan]XP_029912805.1 interferon-induced 35 kDa protein isoform X1 [Myripristis murdjan]
MSSDEDFSLVMDNTQPSVETLEGIKKQITQYKMQHDQIVAEQKELAKTRDDQRDLATKFRQRSEKLMMSLEEDQCSHDKSIQAEREKMDALRHQENVLQMEIEKAEHELEELEAHNKTLKEQTDVTTAVPERKVVFKGLTGDTPAAHLFDMKSHIVYPMEGGTALITFEEEVVAKKILTMRCHELTLGEKSECTMSVEAKPVHLLIPSKVEMDTQICPHRILVSELPKKQSEDVVLDKLEIHFSKTRNGGGEVEKCDMLHDSGNVVITFVASDVAKCLTDKLYHEVELQKGKRYKVKVTPFLNGRITNFKTSTSVSPSQPKLTACPRTVLLTGIHPIMDQESLQDLLEIHFQKATNGGGEVDAFLYNPVGQNTLALFQSDRPSDRQGAL